MLDLVFGAEHDDVLTILAPADIFDHQLDVSEVELDWNHVEAMAHWHDIPQPDLKFLDSEGATVDLARLLIY